MVTRMRKALVVCDMHPDFLSRMQHAGFEVTYLPNIEQEEVAARIPGYEVLVVSTKTKVNRQLMTLAPQLQVVGRSGSGMENIDVAAAADLGIACYSSPEGNRQAVAEHALGMLLALSNNLLRADREVRTAIWRREENRGFEIQGKTVGLVGYGNTGRAFAKVLSGFGCTVLAFDALLTNYGDQFAEEATMEELWQQADIISLHIPLTSATHGMVDRHWLGKWQKRGVLINTSRGPIVELADVLLMLESDKLAGFAADVLPVEPLTATILQQNDALAALTLRDDVVFSPHVAGWTIESHEKLGRYLADKILHHFQSS